MSFLWSLFVWFVHRHDAQPSINIALLAEADMDIDVYASVLERKGSIIRHSSLIAVSRLKAKVRQQPERSS
jgi:hypothetical protein